MPIAARRCVVCSGAMNPNHPATITCSEKCRYARLLERKATAQRQRRQRAKPKGRRCAVCGTSIDHKHGKAMTCSSPCHRERTLDLRWRRLGKPGPRPRFYDLRCAVCGEIFQHKNPNTLTCSTDCRWIRGNGGPRKNIRWEDPDERDRHHRRRAHERRKFNSAEREKKKERQRRLKQMQRDTIRAFREMGMLEGVPIRTWSDRMAVVRAAKELGLI